jgi:AraC family transcriptional regulator
MENNNNNDDYCLQNMRPDVSPPDNNAIFNRIRIDNYTAPPQSLEHTPFHNTIIISTNNSGLAQLEMGGERRDEFFRSRDIMIYPAGIKQSASWDQENAYSVVTIETSFFKSIAHEYRDPDRIDLLPRFPFSDPLIYGAAQILTGQMQHKKLINLEYIDQIAVTLSMHLFKNCCSTELKLPQSSHSLSWKQLNLLYQYVNDNLSKTIALQDLANLVGFSPYYFIRLFKKSTGKTPAQYITHQRLKKAIHLLNLENLDIGLIAQQVGFYDHSHLCLAFRKYLSSTPEQYRGD